MDKTVAQQYPSGNYTYQTVCIGNPKHEVYIKWGDKGAYKCAACGQDVKVPTWG